MPSLTFSAAVVLARTSVPPCFSVMPMPIVTADFCMAGLFVESYLRDRIFGAQSFCTAGDAESGSDGGARHRQRAKMAGFELRRQIEARRPDLVCLVLRLGIGLWIPDRTNAAPMTSNGASARAMPDGTRRHPAARRADHACAAAACPDLPCAPVPAPPARSRSGPYCRDHHGSRAATCRSGQRSADRTCRR